MELLPCTRLITPQCIRDMYNFNYKTPDDKSSVVVGVTGFLGEYANFQDFQDFFAKYGQKEGIHSNRLWEAVRAQRALLDPVGWLGAAMACEYPSRSRGPPSLSRVCACLLQGS